jgi:SAM-dependent methyltransferase
VVPVRASGGIAVGEVAYGSLASVYEWLVADDKASPAASAQAFETVTAGLDPGAQILDCSCGIGLLAVGLAEAGFRVTACDASPAMVERTQVLARAHGVEVSAHVCRWDELPDQGWQDRFDAVLCVGNSLAHAVGRSGRRAAIGGMASVLSAGGVLALTSRNWEQIRAAGTRLDVWDRLVARAGGKAVVAYSWQVPPAWDAEHRLEISVAVLQDGDRLQVATELLSMWPFHHEELRADVASAGLSVAVSTYDATQPNYLLTAQRRAESPT